MQSAEVIPFEAPPPPEPVIRICSFCHKPEDKVKRMLSNGRDGSPQLKCICDACVVQAGKRLAETMAQAKAQKA